MNIRFKFQIINSKLSSIKDRSKHNKDTRNSFGGFSSGSNHFPRHNFVNSIDGEREEDTAANGIQH